MNKPQEDQQDTSLLASLYLLLSLAYLLWMLWLMVPEHRKTALRMRLLRSSSQVTSRLARHAAAAVPWRRFRRRTCLRQSSRNRITAGPRFSAAAARRQSAAGANWRGYGHLPP